MTALNFRYFFRFIMLSFILTHGEILFARQDNLLLFNNLKVKDGLPASEIFTINQDQTGFIWFGTLNGFVRYDGYEMKVFRQDGTGRLALPDNQITAIEKDKQYRLWISCYEGLIYFDTRTWESKQIDLGGIREVRCLLNQGDSVLWVGTADGLFKLDIGTLEYKIYNQQNSKLGSDIIRALYTDSYGQVWVGTFNGLNVISRDGTMNYFELKGNYKPELKNNLVLDIKPYTKNNDSLLWIGTETGLVLFNRTSFKSTVFNSKNTGFGNEVVKCIHPLTDGQIYFGTDFGFYYFNSRTKEFQVSTHDPFNNYSLANNVVWNIFEDSAGVIWLATSNGISQLSTSQGMFRFTPVYNKTGDTQVGNQVNDIYCDNDETIWLATKKGAISILKNGDKNIFTANSHDRNQLVLDNINTITGDNLGRIWIGSAGGINVWDKANQKMYTITANFDLNKGLRSNYISAFVTPPDGSFWVITWGGGMYKAKGDFTNVEYIYFDYVANFNTNILSYNKKIWLKNDKKIYTIDLSTLKIDLPEKLNDVIKNNDINSMLISQTGSLWIGLNNQLIEYNTSTEDYSTYQIQTGRESLINNLTEDFNGDIWGTTLTSIFKFSVDQEEAESFPMNKGIPLDVFLSQSNARSGKGVIYFGGNDGFISFNPAEICKNQFCPKMVISGLKVNNKPINSINELKGKNNSDELITYYNKITLKYDQRSVSIDFSALHFGDPFRNIYAYKLEGYDKYWNYTSGFQNFATYSNLSPDKYQFKVKGTNNDGVWFNNDITLDIVVKPPVWASAWAIVIYIIILQMILIMLVSTYRNKVRWKERLRLITLEKEKNEELSQAKQQFFTNISHEFRTPLNLIMGPVQTLLEKVHFDNDSRTLLQMVSKNSRRLLSLVNQLMDIRKIENRSLTLNLQPIELITFCREQYDLFIDFSLNRKIHFNFEAPVQHIQLTTDPEKLESIIQNLLSNAFKFTSEGGTVSFSVETEEEKLFRIVVSDSGSGIDPNDQQHIFDRFFQGKKPAGRSSGYGIGLNLAKEYCGLMKGKITFTSEPGKGTIFMVEIPVSKIETTESSSIPVIQDSITTDEQSANKKVVITDAVLLPTVLLVDDHPDTLEYIKICLAGKYTFLTAGNGQDAMRIIEKSPVDIVVSDIMMPLVDGLSLCEKIKANPRFVNLPVILLTAMAMSSDQVEGLRAGADAYLTKPFSIEVLEARIESLLVRNQKVDDYIKRRLIIENQDVEIESYDEKLLSEAIQFINRYISDPEINIDKMCKEIGVSHSSLYRKVKAQTGLTLNELIRHVKMQKAAQLIKSKKMSISEIMDETGFSNHSYFAKCFKNEFHISPREYADKK